MNLTNVFIDILRSAMTQTSCDMIEGLSTQDWEKIYDISQKQQLAPMIYQQIFSNESFQNSDPGFQQFWKGDTIDQAGNQARKSILFLMLFDKMRQNGLTPLIVKELFAEIYIQIQIFEYPMMKIFISQEISLGRWMNFCRQRDL